MKRKRFIKLLMAKGYSRNEAQTMALVARQDGKSYAEAYHAYHPTLEQVSKLLSEISEAVKDAIDSISSFAAALYAGASAFSEAFLKSLSTEGEHERYTSNDQAAPGVLCLPQNGD